MKITAERSYCFCSISHSAQLWALKFLTITSQSDFGPRRWQFGEKTNSGPQNHLRLIKMINVLTATSLHISFLLHRVEPTENVVLPQSRAGGPAVSSKWWCPSVTTTGRYRATPSGISEQTSHYTSHTMFSWLNYSWSTHTGPSMKVETPPHITHATARHCSGRELVGNKLFSIMVMCFLTMGH